MDKSSQKPKQPSTKKKPVASGNPSHEKIVTLALRSSKNQERRGKTPNADFNAARVIAMRGARLIASGEYKRKEKKRAAIRKKTVGAESSEPTALVPSTPGETAVRHDAGNSLAHWSQTQETPATAQA